MPKPTPDWKAIHADRLEELAEAMERAMMEKVTHEVTPKADFYRWAYGGAPPLTYTVVLEWRGWRFIEVVDGVALGAEFYRDLPNGKRGLFGKGESFVTSDDKPGILFHCLEEE